MSKELHEFELHAIITAAGSSQRMGQGTPKPLLKLPTNSGPVSILRLSVLRLMSAADFKSVHVTAPQAYLEAFKSELVDLHPKLEVITGGNTRQESVHCALKAISAAVAQNEQDCLVCIHDAARCFVSKRLVRSVIESAAANRSATAAIKVVDALNRFDKNAVLGEAVDRSNVVAIQTPQVFHLDDILKAHESAKGKIVALDDAGLLENIHIVSGERLNFKITEPEDYQFACAISANIVGDQNEN